jgi:hypothetical protein
MRLVASLLFCPSDMGVSAGEHKAHGIALYILAEKNQQRVIDLRRCDSFLEIMTVSIGREQQGSRHHCYLSFA